MIGTKLLRRTWGSHYPEECYAIHNRQPGLLYPIRERFPFPVRHRNLDGVRRVRADESMVV